MEVLAHFLAQSLSYVLFNKSKLICSNLHVPTDVINDLMLQDMPCSIVVCLIHHSSRKQNINLIIKIPLAPMGVLAHGAPTPLGLIFLSSACFSPLDVHTVKVKQEISLKM